MELRYCELCGDIIKVNEEGEGAMRDRYMCERCEGRQSDTPQRQKQKAEDVSLRTSAPVEGALAGAEAGGAEDGPADADREGVVPHELSLDSLLASHELDFFSPDTLAAKRKESAARQKSKSASASKTKIRLLDPEEPTQEVGAADDLSDAKTVSTATAQAPRPAAGGAASGLPKKRMQFPCPACRTTLAIQAVTKVSRLRCPRCHSRMTVDPERRAKLIEAGSKAVKRSAAPAPSEGGDLLKAPLLESHPDAEFDMRPEQAFTPTEGLITCQSTSDLSDLAYAADIPAKPSPPRPQAPKQQRPAAGPKQGAPAAYGDIPAKDSVPKETAPRSVQRPAQRVGLSQAEPPQGALVPAFKALALGIVLALPFYVWAGLLSLNASETFRDYFTAYGEMVREFLQVILRR